MDKPTIQQTVQSATQQLADISDSARIDVEILLAHTLACSRTRLHTYPDVVLSSDQLSVFHQMLTRRQLGEPIAYLTGYREFWSLDLEVTKDTLIPRPETELLVEAVLARLPHGTVQTIADLGTGSGAIALALAHECPTWQIYASDESSAALAVAKKNALRLGLKSPTFLLGDWCSALPNIQFDAIVSNPPYIAEDDRHLEEGGLCFEPRSALVAEDMGLRDLCIIAEQARDYLRAGASLLFEIGYQQATPVCALLDRLGYIDIQVHADLAGHPRVVAAQYHLRSVIS